MSNKPSAGLEPETLEQLWIVVEHHIKTERMCMLAIRQMLLGQVDAIERAIGINPRTAEIRTEVSRNKAAPSSSSRRT